MRARRLLPALFLLLLGTLAFAVVFLPEEVAGLRKDAMAAAGYVSNWYLVLSQKSYFESVGRPSLLGHLWSLAVEEQFYLVWPLLFALGMRRVGRRNLLPFVLAGAALSTALMAALYQPDVDPSRVYYGTDTRAAALLLGAALAFVWAPGRDIGRASGWLLDGIGLGGLGLLLAAFVLVNEFEPALYRGGFAVLSLVTLVVIAVSVHPRAHLGPRLLGWAPLRWVGLRSYGIYLWHYPVYMVTRPQLDVSIEGLPLLALRCALTCLLAELSYRFVEMPVRSGALGQGLALAARSAWPAEAQPRHALGPSVLGVFVIFTVALGESVVSAMPPPPPSYLEAEATAAAALAAGAPVAPQVAPVAPTEEPTGVRTQSACGRGPGGRPRRPRRQRQRKAPAAAIGPTCFRQVAPAARSGLSARRVPRRHRRPPRPPIQVEAAPSVISARSTLSPTEPAATMAAASRPCRPPPKLSLRLSVLAIGDSVMLGAIPQLQAALPGIEIDAKLGRQVSNAIAVLSARKAAGTLPPVVVVDMGSNGTFSAKQFDQMMALLVDEKRVVFVNVKVPRTWEVDE